MLFHPLPHGAVGIYDDLICFGALILGGVLYLVLYFASGQRLKHKKDQHGQD